MIRKRCLNRPIGSRNQGVATIQRMIAEAWRVVAEGVTRSEQQNPRPGDKKERYPVEEHKEKSTRSKKGTMNPEVTVRYKKVAPGAFEPTRKTRQSAGYDLRLLEDVLILPKTRRLVDLGISIEIPEGYYGRISTRSTVAISCEVDIQAGVIDADFRGTVKLLLHNTSCRAVYLERGQSPAQLIIQPCMTATFLETEEEFEATERTIQPPSIDYE